MMASCRLGSKGAPTPATTSSPIFLKASTIFAYSPCAAPPSAPAAPPPPPFVTRVILPAVSSSDIACLACGSPMRCLVDFPTPVCVTPVNI